MELFDEFLLVLYGKIFFFLDVFRTSNVFFFFFTSTLDEKGKGLTC